MGHGKSKGQRRAEQQIAQLEVKKRSGLVRMVFAIALMAALIATKIGLVNAGVAWASSDAANLGIFAAAIVLAAVAGMGSRAWTLSNKKLKEVRAQMRS